MNSKKFSIFFFALFFAAFALAATSDSSQVNGDLILSIEKTQYTAGETINAEITVLSMENFPIAEAKVVVELAKGGQPYYPSTLSADNIFFEQSFDGINLRAAESKKINFSYKLPENLSAGDYRIDAYFRTERSAIVGLAHIFLGAKAKQFTVKNSAKSQGFPEAKILRATTEFKDSENILTVEGPNPSGNPEPAGIGPIGPPTKPGAAINGKVFVQNTTGQALSNVEVTASLCVWDDTFCSSFLSQGKAVIGSINANSTAEADITLQAPSRPDAYSIRLEVKKADGQLISLYRNRAVVVGESARIRKLYSQNVELLPGKNTEFYSVISPGADHWLRPEFRNFSLKFSVQDLKTGEILLQKTEQIPLIDYKINFIASKFEFVPQKEILNYKVCEAIEKSGVTFDSYCVVYDSSKFSKIINYSLDSTAIRSRDNSEVEMKFCTLPSGQEINANYQLLSESMQDFVSVENLAGKDCISRIIRVDPSKKYVLAVTDYVTKTQKIISIGLVAENQQVSGGQSAAEQRLFGGSTIILIIEAIVLLIGVFMIFVALTLMKKKKRKKK
ncbi:MAG: hypothetical protein Q7R70_02810 [Candidatus Diapherotrites archaeon]|nr:hypothetical protein [Candidatus Diapherotrites archaeon]